MPSKRIIRPGILLALFVLACPGASTMLQWIETPTGEMVLMLLTTNRFLKIDPKTLAVICDSPGPVPGGSDSVRFVWALTIR